jgi:hypothetical protein
MNRNLSIKWLSWSMPILCWVALWSPRASAEESRSIFMVKGEDQEMAIKGLERVYVGNQHVADVKKSGPESIIVYATGEGQTTLRFQRKGQVDLYVRIKVVAQDRAEGIPRQTFTLKYADPESLGRILEPYLTNKGILRVEPKTRTITLVDEQAVLDAAVKIIERFDVKPVQLQLLFRLVAATQVKEPAPVPADLQPIARQIQEIMRFNQFTAVDQAFLLTQGGAESTLHIGGEPGYTIYVTPEILEGDTGAVRLHVILAHYHGNRSIIDTRVELRDGETVVLGASKIDGGDKALITVVNLKTRK